MRRIGLVLLVVLSLVLHGPLPVAAQGHPGDCTEQDLSESTAAIDGVTVVYDDHNLVNLQISPNAADYAETMAQLGQAAACNRIHELEQRAARWLLAVADRQDAPEFDLTHEFLGVMLGAHRPTVTLAVGMLRAGGFIENSRARFEIIDREGLEGAACECYAFLRDDYRQVMGFPL